MRTWLVAFMATGFLSAQEPPDLNPGLGKKLFEAHCAPCHGIDGTGGRGPNLAVAKLKRVSDNQGVFDIAKNGIPGTVMDGAWQLSDAELWRIVNYTRSLGHTAAAALPGDPMRGKVIYYEQGCYNCHIVSGLGTGFGPELTTVGASRGAAYLRQSITKPEAVIPEGFATIHVRTQDGRDIQGIRVNEDSFTVQVKDRNNRFHSFRKADLALLEMEPAKSTMPAYRITSGEIDDLVSYLASLRGEE